MEEMMLNEKTQTLTWREVLVDKIEPEWAAEIDEFDTQMALRRQGIVDEKVFAELRLRRV
jgi:sulfite reductase (ferredoxin)